MTSLSQFEDASKLLTFAAKTKPPGLLPEARQDNDHAVWALRWWDTAVRLLLL
jgi:hypothetical protein